MVDARGVGRQVGALGDDVESCKDSDSLIHDQIHHVALPFRANQLQRQQAADGPLGGDHLRARQAGGGDHPNQIDAV